MARLLYSGWNSTWTKMLKLQLEHQPTLCIPLRGALQRMFPVMQRHAAFIPAPTRDRAVQTALVLSPSTHELDIAADEKEAQ
ncbi:hypothetical protein VCV18_011790 [Metarhizium anisopliae]